MVKKLGICGKELIYFLSQIRTLSAVLLRRLFTNDFMEWWATLPPDLQAGVKTELINAIQEELTPPVKRKICDAAAELARNLIG